MFAYIVERYYCAQENKDTFGTIQHFLNFKSKFIDARSIDVWLPIDYSNKEKYAAHYMHDGQMIYRAENTWNKLSWKAHKTATQSIDSKKHKNLLLVEFITMEPNAIRNTLIKNLFKLYLKRNRTLCLII